MQRLRVQYAKRGRLRFSSHRDFQRAFERALRRAGVPIAFSAGFSPHPKVSYANAAPTGTASEAEYLEIGVTTVCDPARLRLALDDALPPGLDIVDVVVASSPDFAARLEASVWQIEFVGMSEATLSTAITVFLAAEEVLVERLMKQGKRVFDARSSVLLARVAMSPEPILGSECAILTLVVRHSTPAVRPDDVLAALRRVADLVPPTPPRVTRLAQGPLAPDGQSVGDPLALDRE
ncbi:MAG: TIGR03936 family radical SAM-associated protein [Actinomycetota bacterium]|nr:TIGR03936 family radical SAM-associated protein [Actinomycetota bacterium]